jgi:hypothetical protein
LFLRVPFGHLNRFFSVWAVCCFFGPIYSLNRCSIQYTYIF